jgi:hypothetical protein
MTGASVRFDEHQIRLIIKALPEGISARKLELLPGILNEWSGNYLKWSLYRVNPTVAKGRAKRMEAIAKHAGELSRALDEFVDYAGGDEFLDFPGDSWLVFELAKRISPMGFQDEVSGQRQKLEDQRKFLHELESVATDLAGIFKRSMDQRQKIPEYRVMLDIAAIYEWLTGRKAARRVERGTDTFGDFARSIWPVIFEKGDEGLESALKNWAKGTKVYGDKSALIANIDFHYPAWGVFDA